MTNSRNDFDAHKENRLETAVAAARIIADSARQSAEALPRLRLLARARTRSTRGRCRNAYPFQPLMAFGLS